MVGWQIFVHSLRMVFGNMSEALRIFGILYLPVAAFYLIPMPTKAESGVSLFFFVLAFLVGFLLAALLSFCMAIAWHRYILLGDWTGALLPPFRPGRLVVYLLRSLLVTLIMLPVLLVGAFIFVFGSTLWSTPFLATVGGNILGFVLSVVFYRLAPVLPAAAIDRDLSIGEAWRATRGATWPIVVVAILSTIASTALSMAGIPFAAMPILTGLWLAITGWINLTVGVTIVTTIYGHYVEGRPIVPSPT